MEKIKCTECEMLIIDGNKFCSRCGKPVTNKTQSSEMNLPARITAQTLKKKHFIACFGIMLSYVLAFAGLCSLCDYLDRRRWPSDDIMLLLIFGIIILTAIQFGTLVPLGKPYRDGKTTMLALLPERIHGKNTLGEWEIPYTQIKMVEILPETAYIKNLLGTGDHTIKITTGTNEFIFPYIKEAEKIAFEIRNRMV